MLLRWWRELRRPDLKCARLGHDCKPRLYRGYCLPGEVSDYNALVAKLDGAVAFKVNVIFHICQRCKFEDVAHRRVTVEYPIKSLSMSIRDWDEMEKNGFLLRSE